MTQTDTSAPTWYAATKVDARERGPLTRDIDVDVCVIGAGLAGLTVAREVARRGWSIAVLEAEQVAALASGRSGGVVSAGFAERIEAIVDRVGLPRAKELWALSAAGAEYVRRAIAETNMPGVAPRDGKLTVRRTDDETALIEHVAMLRVEFGADVEAWPADQVREVLRTGAYFQAVHDGKAFHIHPLNYALGLAAAAEAAGARIYEGTTALSIDPAGVRKRIQTSGGLVRAHHAVLAGNVQAGRFDRELGGTVLPVTTYIAVTAPLGENLFDAVRYTGAVADTRRAGNYFRVVADDRLMWGAHATTRRGTPRRLKAMMKRDLLRTFPQLRDAEIEHAWAGTMGYAVHKMPQIGELSPGYWLLGAFGGHGLNTTAMAGEMVARAILENDDRWRLFSAYELVWTGGVFGRLATQAALSGMQARDALVEQVARYRDRARREAAEQQARWDAERAARLAEREAQKEREAAARAAEEAARLAEIEARKVAAELRRQEEAARKAEEDARKATELEARRIADEAEARLAAEAAAVQAAAAKVVAEAKAVDEAPVAVKAEVGVAEPVTEPVTAEAPQAAAKAAPAEPEAAPPAPAPEPVMPEPVVAAPEVAPEPPKKARKKRSKKKQSAADQPAA